MAILRASVAFLVEDDSEGIGHAEQLREGFTRIQDAARRFDGQAVPRTPRGRSDGLRILNHRRESLVRLRP